jgi:hypothetical protein
LLAPAIAEAILDGRQAAEITLSGLMAGVVVEWRNQHRSRGYAGPAIRATDAAALPWALEEDKMMFSVGQRVWHRDGRRSGKVLECAGGRVYIEQDNGAELDFPMSELTAAPPAAGQGSHNRSKDSSPASKKAEYGMLNRTLIAADITLEHTQVLGIVPARTMQAVATLYERRPGASKFSGLDVAGKLNVIAEITAVPYRTMREYRDRPGELGLLMGKGLADSQTNGR